MGVAGVEGGVEWGGGVGVRVLDGGEGWEGEGGRCMRVGVRDGSGSEGMG